MSFKKQMLLLGLGLSACGWAMASAGTLPDTWQSAYDRGVEAYRNGRYDAAIQQFQPLSQAVPEFQEGHYYRAITLAQLGRYTEARQAYETVIRLAPQTQAATLSQEGLAALPDPEQLDRPPLFQTGRSQTGASSAPKAGGGENPMGNMDPKTLQMLLMMGSMGGGGNGGMNMMMLPLLQRMGQSGQGADTSAGDDFPGSGTIPPDAMSTMMMNQMMQHMDFFGGTKSEND